MSTYRLAFPAALLILSCASAQATPLLIAGSYGGSINGTPLAAHASGTMDTDGSGGHMRIEFSAIANASFNPMALGSSFASMVGWVTALRQNTASLNLYDLGHGSYTLDRWIIWDDPLNEDVRVMGGAHLDGDTLRFGFSLNGQYNGPLDIVGVSHYRTTWATVHPNTVDEAGQARLALSDGSTHTVSFESVFGDLQRDLVSIQDGELFSQASYLPTGPTSGVLDISWQAQLAARHVDEPASAGLLLIGAAALARGASRGRGDGGMKRAPTAS